MGFIDTISQNADGVITATKKTVEFNDLYQIVDYTYEYTAAANTYVSISGTNFGISTPSGYTPVAVTASSSGHGSVTIALINARATGSTTAMGLRNVSSSSITQIAQMSIMYFKKHS